jgi:hypothetical protein
MAIDENVKLDDHHNHIEWKIHNSIHQQTVQILGKIDLPLPE